MSNKVSQPFGTNLYWVHDERNSKMMINFVKLYESYLHPESSRLFAKFKTETVKNFMERGHYPNTLMSEVSKADEDYQVLKNMLGLY
jgi:hypothetical protein